MKNKLLLTPPLRNALLHTAHSKTIRPHKNQVRAPFSDLEKTIRQPLKNLSALCAFAQRMELIEGEINFVNKAIGFMQKKDLNN